jgi:hypothetical protein
MNYSDFTRRRVRFENRKCRIPQRLESIDSSQENHHQLQEHQIQNICTAIVVQVYGPEMVSPSKGKQFQVRLTGARQAATMWSYVDRQMANKRLECKIHHVTPT